MHLRNIACSVAVALVVAACGSRGRPKQGDASSSAGSVSPAASAAPICTDGQRAIRKRAVAASRSCTTDEDCDCVDLPQAERMHRVPPLCGIVASRATAASLREENARLTAGGCVPPELCPPAPCRSACFSGGGAHGMCGEKTRCNEITDLATALIARIDRSCRQDADCDQYPAGLVKDCGGAASRNAIAPLLQLAKEHRELNCKFAVSCAPRFNRPARCSGGTCSLP